MALQQDDLVFDYDDGFVQIPLLSGGTYVYITQIFGNKLKVRVDTGNSDGILLDKDSQFKTPSDIYVKPSSNTLNNGLCSITVVRDKA